VVAVALMGAPSASVHPLDGIHNIQHVVMIMQEDRSFDSYFGTYPGANEIPAGVCEPDPVQGGCAAPFHDHTDKNCGGPHGHEGIWNPLVDFLDVKKTGSSATSVAEQLLHRGSRPEQVRGCRTSPGSSPTATSPNIRLRQSRRARHTSPR
jgi:phospholipase C